MSQLAAVRALEAAQRRGGLDSEVHLISQIAGDDAQAYVLVIGRGRFRLDDVAGVLGHQLFVRFRRFVRRALGA